MQDEHFSQPVKGAHKLKISNQQIESINIFLHIFFKNTSERYSNEQIESMNIF